MCGEREGVGEGVVRSRNAVLGHGHGLGHRARRKGVEVRGVGAVTRFEWMAAKATAARMYGGLDP